jgi:outer membrane protein assembly factor BamD
MAHFRMMAKADRDQTEARLAEAEFKEFLLKYPENAVVVRVKARLRETQEVLGEGEYETASFYLSRGAYRAARGRFQEIVDTYPNFSLGDEALFGLCQSFEHLKKPNEAAPYYARLVRNFPLSPHLIDAQNRLMAMHQPVPKASKATLARAQADAARLRGDKTLLGKLTTAMASSPDTSATLRGPVQLRGSAPTGVEMAKGAPAPSTPPSAAIVAEPVGEASLNPGRSADPNPSAEVSRSPGAKTEANASNSAPTASGSKVQQDKVASSGNDSGKAEKAKKNPDPFSVPSQKKKGRFHVLKKIVKPI